jgi:KDO2-lipid IV(A) lauroyltransferase
MAKAKDTCERLIFRTFEFLFFLLPRRLCLFLGRAFGFLAYYLDKKHRKIALSNLEIAFGKEWPESRREKIARNSLISFCQTVADMIKLSLVGDKRKEKLMTVEGEENLQEALKEGKGVLIFSAHFGNWEMGSFFISKVGKLEVVARALDNELLEKELTKLRINLGANVIYKKMAAKQILQSLRRNEMVAILIDQNVLRSEGVFVDFFGKEASTTPALARFFLRTRSPIVPVFCYPTRSRHYRLKILKPLHIETEGDYSRDVLKITQLCTKIIESEIRQNPEFWFWFHNRWKSRPEKEKPIENRAF